MKVSWLSLLTASAIGLILVACGPSAIEAPTATPPAISAPAESTGILEQPVTDDTGSANEPYPAPAVAEQPLDPYPADGQPAVPEPTPLPDVYPAVVDETFLEPRFRIDQPLAANATEVTGQAPPGLTLGIMDITFNASTLGAGVSDADGRFIIPVSPLPAGHRIGLAITAVPEGQALEQMPDTYFPYRGEGFMNIPNLGLFFDTALVGQ